MFELSDPDRGLLEQTYALRFRLNFGLLLRIPFLVSPIVIIFLSPIVLIIGIIVAVWWWIRNGSKGSTAIKTGIAASGITGIGFIAWYLYSISTSCSSTAAIGYIFLPCYTFLVCAATYLIAWSMTTIIQALRVSRIREVNLKTWTIYVASRIREINPKKWTIYAAMCILILFGFLGFKIATRNLLLKKAYTTTTEFELSVLYNKAVSNEDIELMAKIVKNPNTSEELLRRIYFSIPSTTFQYPGSQYSAVFWQLAKNAKTPPDVLSSLNEKREGERVAIATNPNTPVDVLERLAEDRKSLVRTCVCANPNVTKEILMKLKDDPDKVVRSYANTYLRRHGFSD